KSGLGGPAYRFAHAGYGPAYSSPFIRPFQLRHIELLHAEHRLHDALRACRVLVLQALAEDRRDDLPGHAELVLEPAAALDLATGSELVPKRIHFILRLAIHEQREAL